MRKFGEMAPLGRLSQACSLRDHFTETARSAHLTQANTTSIHLPQNRWLDAPAPPVRWHTP